MGVIVKPNLTVEDIEIEINDNDKEGADKMLELIGPKMPVIKVNDYVLNMGELRKFTLDIELNSVPTFNMVIDDTEFNVRKSLQKEKIDKVIIFIGYKDWYIKFNGIISNVYSSTGKSSLNITGRFFNDKLYGSNQKAYNEKSVFDVLKDVCTNTNMGLFTIENDLLSKVIKNNLNPNKSNIDYIEYIIKKFTNNIWSFDTYGFLHIGDIESLHKQPYDKFSIYNGKKQDEKDMVLTTDKFFSHDEDIEKPKEKFIVESFNINSNIGYNHVTNYKEFTVEDTETIKKLKTNSTNDFIGINTTNENTFKPFTENFYPFNKDIINKDISTKGIKLKMFDIIYELSPLSIINLELYVPRNSSEEFDGELPEGENSKQILDTENSGKKIVIGFDLTFSLSGNNETTICQNINLI